MGDYDDSPGPYANNGNYESHPGIACLEDGSVLVVYLGGISSDGGPPVNNKYQYQYKFDPVTAEGAAMNGDDYEYISVLDYQKTGSMTVAQYKGTNRVEVEWFDGGSYSSTDNQVRGVVIDIVGGATNENGFIKK